MMDRSMEFKGGIIIESKEQALEEAIKDRTDLVLRTDESKLHNGKVGAAVCWRDTRLGQWKDKTRFLGENKEILDAELWAILEALGIARKETPNARHTSINIFCGSQKAPRTIQHPRIHHENWFLRSLIYPESSNLTDIS